MQVHLEYLILDKMELLQEIKQQEEMQMKMGMAIFSILHFQDI